VLAGERQVWGPNAIKADLPELTAGAADLDPRDSRRIKYFRSTGLGIEDAVVARLYCASLGLR
jgi:ornithine cyclodeaminase/alanine dehydrogenase-like protein (mu-crystallin family)